ncbi:DUF1376 domain-containing protein [Bordetella petrii]|uniref:DUF1376 domain-containing protein n=1 Tax=Bordetella petrii TaxID=94624 RepID=UPI001E62236B|nr:DUF1376 domain-containing protein [Bordetella petrii]
MTPLTPADCDLQDFQFMPLDVLRLRDSDLAIHTTGEEFRCAVLLWCAAWHQVPAASLPDDDKSLASLAGYGRAVNEWLKHKEGALRGWIKCEDGRLYHPVVAEKAREAWASKHRHAHQKLSERVRKLNKIREQRGLPAVVVPPFDEWLSAGMPTERDLLPPENDTTSGGKQAESGGSDDGIPPENALKGQGQGQGEKRKESDRAREDENYLPSPTAYGLMAKLLRTHGIDVAPGRPDFREWVDKGLTDEEALAAIQSARLSKPAPEPIPWPYLAKVLTTQRQAAQAVPDKPAQPAKAAPQVDRWWINEAGIDRKARELGMFARGGETYPAFKDRIFAELRKRGEATPQEQAA